MKKLSITPQSIAGRKSPPEDAWTDSRPFSIEDLERIAKERATKKEVIPQHNSGKFSLRNILPDRWGVAYQETMTNVLVDVEAKKYEKRAAYLELKHELLYKSFVLGYGVGPIQRVTPTRELARFIKEHCASAMRLKAMSLRAYEYFSGMGGFGVWTSMGWPVFLCLASAKSSLDAMASVIQALVVGMPKQGAKLPDMYGLWKTLCPERKPKLPFGKEFEKLYKSRWYKNLVLARNQVVHRGMWPKYKESVGVALKHDISSLKDRPYGFYEEQLTELTPKNSFKLIRLDELMVGFVAGLEKWEQQVAKSLAAKACFKPYMTDGIIEKVYFNPNGPLMDFGGPEGMITTDSEEFVKIQMRRSQRKSRTRARSEK